MQASDAAVTKVITADAPAAPIGDKDTVFAGGSGGGHGVPEKILAALADRFARTESPRDLTVMSVVAIGDRTQGSAGPDPLAQPRLARRVITASLGLLSVGARAPIRKRRQAWRS